MPLRHYLELRAEGSKWIEVTRHAFHPPHANGTRPSSVVAGVVYLRSLDTLIDGVAMPLRQRYRTIPLEFGLRFPQNTYQ